MESVRSHRARAVVEAARLHRSRDRKERGLTLVEGPELLGDVIAAGANVVECFAVEPPRDSPTVGALSTTPVDPRALERLAGTKSPRGPVAVVEIPTEWLDSERNLLVSVGVSDPGNVGTMIRTAAAFGWGFAYQGSTADPWAPKTIRAGAGGQFQTSVARIGSVAELGEWTTVASVVSGGETVETIPSGHVALLIGEEAHGLDEKVAGSAAYRVTIPTSGNTESLNAAIAAGILMYAITIRSGQGGADV